MREAAKKFEFEKAAKLRDIDQRSSHEGVSIQLEAVARAKPAMNPPR